MSDILIKQSGNYLMTSLFDTYRKHGVMLTGKFDWNVEERETKEQRVLKILAKIDDNNSSSNNPKPII